mmetsp:Transcript_31735/g.53537  ORF Transcript_31735/g.53537 Transcript_31735/m.53537 type:complete len:144 (-) Transcript_31735:77-508(-)
MASDSLTWSKYLARGTPTVIYHMCDEATFLSATKDGGMYFPTTYEQDGFVHATAIPSDLVACGNHFYKSVKGKWVCIALNSLLLGAEVKFETAAPVGDTATFDTGGLPKFPHIYGGIPGKAAMKMYDIVRSEDGTFLGITGLC